MMSEDVNAKSGRQVFDQHFPSRRGGEHLGADVKRNLFDQGISKAAIVTQAEKDPRGCVFQFLAALVVIVCSVS